MNQQLAPDVERQIRLCAVPPHLAATLARLPRRLSLELTLPSPAGEMGIAARQWLKLALREEGVVLSGVRAGDALSLKLTLDGRERTLHGPDLAIDLREGLPSAVLDLFGPADVAVLLEQLGYSTSSLATLRKVTSRMLATSDMNVAYRLLLRGVTAGFGLGFHRAAVCALDGDMVRGVWAEGHVDETEAHAVWESLELEDVDVERTLDDAVDNRPSALAHAAKKLRFSASDPWVERILAAAGATVCAAAERGPLDALDIQTPFVVAPLRARGAAVGFLFADDRWDPAASISSERVQLLELFADQAALVIDNLRLFERVLGLSRTDPLTGLANRRELDARFALLADRARRGGRSIGLLVIDVDHFKQTNDSAGHEAGDEVLRRVARLVERSVRAEDSVARFGGDEFVVLLPDTERAPLVRIARRIGVEAAGGGLSLSIGGATFPADVDAPEELFAAADAALYRSKAAGRRRGYIGGEHVDFE